MPESIPAHKDGSCPASYPVKRGDRCFRTMREAVTHVEPPPAPDPAQESDSSILRWLKAGIERLLGKTREAAEKLAEQEQGGHVHPHDADGVHDHPGLPAGSGGHAHGEADDGSHAHRPGDPLDGAHANEGQGYHTHSAAHGELSEADGPLETLQKSPNTNLHKPCFGKIEFYKRAKAFLPRYPNSAVVELFAGRGNNPSAEWPGNHFAIDKDDKAIESYRRKYPGRHVVHGDNADSSVEFPKTMKVRAIDADASASPFQAIYRALDSFAITDPILLTATWGYLGTSIQRGVDRKKAWAEMQSRIRSAAKTRGLESHALFYSHPSGKNESNHLIYGAFSLGKPGRNPLSESSG